MKCSLITLAYKRNQHLENLLKGLSRGIEIPDEIIVVDIDDTVILPEDVNLDIRLISCPKTDKTMPLAKARNLGAQHASFEVLIFLDVDCIPSRNFFTSMQTYLDCCPGLIMGRPRYLTCPVNNDLNEDRLKELSTDDPGQPELLANIKQTSVYKTFRSLCFGICKSAFTLINGFDEDYSGYGVEDTDFAFKAREHGVPLYLSDAVVYHQQHPVYSPQVNHLHDILEMEGRPITDWLKSI